MAEIVAPGGVPLACAALSCRSLEQSRRFYCDAIGFAAGPVAEWRGPEFERWWRLPAGASARTCLLMANNCAAGRILLLEFAGAGAAELIQPEPHSRVIGLANLNFYTANAHAAVATLRTQGFRFWSEPTQHSLDASVGNPIEVIFDGPDGVAINLVELTSKDPATRIGQMRAYVERMGYTPQGFTPVVTTSHVARSAERCCALYDKVCGMGRLFEDVIGADRVNDFLRIPRGGRTRLVFMQGNHMYGKVAVSEPLNYLDECIDLAPRARAPNVGYLAQIFEVRSLEHSLAAAAALECEVLAPRARLTVPGLGARDQALLRNPGSGALTWLVQ